MSEQGKIKEVSWYPIKDFISAPAVAGGLVLSMDDVSTFDEAGQIQIGLNIYTYIAKDEDSDVNTLTLDPTTPLLADVAFEDEVSFYPLTTEKMALVDPDDGQDWVRAVIDHSLQASIPEGVRDPGSEETAIMEIEEGQRVIKNILGREQVIDGTSIDPTTLPTAEPASDGLVPAKVTGVTAAGAIRSVVLSWPEVLNFDTVTYQIFGSTEAGFVPGPANLVGEVAGNLFFAQKVYDATIGGLVDLDPTKGPYRFRVLSIDEDGPAEEYSDEVSATPLQITSPDIATNAVVAASILAGSVTADKFAAVMIIASKLLLGDRITQSDLDGIEIRTDTGVIKFPSDGTAAMIYSDLIAFSLEVRNSLNVRGPDNFLAGTLTSASGILDPVAAPTLSNYWTYTQITPIGGEADFTDAVAICTADEGNTSVGGWRYLDQYGLVYAYDPVTFDSIVQVWRWSPDGTQVKIKDLFTGTSEPVWDINQFGASMVSHNDASGTANNHFITMFMINTDGSWSWKIRKYDKNFNFVADYPVQATGIGFDEIPVIGNNITNNGLVMAWKRASDSKLCIRTVSDTGVQGAVVASTATITKNPSFINGSASGVGYNVAIDNVLQRYTTALARVTADDFAHSSARGSKTIYGESADFWESFVELDDDGKLWHYTWYTEHRTVKGLHTWYDGDPLGTYGAGGESKGSQVRTFNLSAGAFCRVDIPAPPDGGDPDDPDRVRLYMNDDGTAVYNLIGALAVGQLSTYISDIGASTPPPAVSAFAGRPGAVGRFKAAKNNLNGVPVWDLFGNGPGRVGPLEWDQDGNDLTDTGWLNPTFSNSWVSRNPASTSSDRKAQYKKVGKRVHMEGLIQGGAVGTVAFTLPVGMRPSDTIQRSSIASGNVVSRIQIGSNGQVTIVSGSGTWNSIGCDFEAEQ